MMEEKRDALKFISFLSPVTAANRVLEVSSTPKGLALLKHSKRYAPCPPAVVKRGRCLHEKETTEA